MGRDKARRLSGSRHFRQRVVLATLTSTAITIEDIRSGGAAPGLRPHELRYKPGVIVGGRDLEHDCGVHRGIGYFLEPLILLGLFARAPISIRLKGITNDTKDPSVDTFRMVTLHMLKQFGVPLEGLELKIESRGAPPLGGGEVFLRVPNINSTLKVSAGYGVSVVAETTTGCLLSADATVSYPNVDEMNEESENSELTSPEDLGVQVASMLLEEVAQGGVVDSTHQGLLFILCALSPPDVSKVRVGQLTPYAIETLRNIRDFLDVKFIIKPDPNSNTVTLKCVGAGVKNLARKTSDAKIKLPKNNNSIN
uniref:RNA 3'-terminal phosphate cyclase domain-containing protein n=1 Tax=Oryza meridionalis TaxID=40149 RepID=A0A0E0D965_9ORYZ